MCLVNKLQDSGNKEGSEIAIIIIVRSHVSGIKLLLTGYY